MGRAALERLAWSGACDELAGGGSHARRAVLWQLGVAKPAQRVGAGTARQLALELELAGAPRLRALGEWESMLADYASTGVSIAKHPLSLLRPSLSGMGLLDVAELESAPHGAIVGVAGLVIARQRPSTAKGVTFLLLEDERGTVNVIVAPALYERQRLTIRSEPLVLVTGRFERHAAGAGAINIIAQDVKMLDVADHLGAPERELASVRDLPRRGEGSQASGEPAAATHDLRAVVPPVISFAAGRRR